MIADYITIINIYRVRTGQKKKTIKKKYKKTKLTNYGYSSKVVEGHISPDPPASPPRGLSRYHTEPPPLRCMPGGHMETPKLPAESTPRGEEPTRSMLVGHMEKATSEPVVSPTPSSGKSSERPSPSTRHLSTAALTRKEKL